MSLDDLGEAGPKRNRLDEERDDVLERRGDRRHLDGDDLLQREPPADLVLHRAEDVDVAELLDGSVERVDLGDRAVPVEHELHAQPATRCSRTPIPSTSIETPAPASRSSSGSDGGPATMSPG